MKFLELFEMPKAPDNYHKKEAQKPISVHSVRQDRWGAGTSLLLHALLTLSWSTPLFTVFYPGIVIPIRIVMTVLGNE